MEAELIACVSSALDGVGSMPVLAGCCTRSASVIAAASRSTFVAAVLEATSTLAVWHAMGIRSTNKARTSISNESSNIFIARTFLTKLVYESLHRLQGSIAGGRGCIGGRRRSHRRENHVTARYGCCKCRLDRVRCVARCQLLNVHRSRAAKLGTRTNDQLHGAIHSNYPVGHFGQCVGNRRNNQPCATHCNRNGPACTARFLAQLRGAEPPIGIRSAWRSGHGIYAAAAAPPPSIQGTAFVCIIRSLLDILDFPKQQKRLRAFDTDEQQRKARSRRWVGIAVLEPHFDRELLCIG